jgi:hypothetical protein
MAPTARRGARPRDPRPRDSRARDSRARDSRTTLLAPLAVLAGLVLSGLFVVQGTVAAFTATTGSPASSWNTGTVTLGDDDGGSALFTTSGLLPGDTGTRCIRVTYTGSVGAVVRLFAPAVTGTLPPHVDLVVEEGSAASTGSYGSCTGFTGTQVWSGPLSTFPTTFAAGGGTFAPTAAGQSAVYRFTYTLSAATPGSQQGATAGATFRWESRS